MCSYTGYSGSSYRQSLVYMYIVFYSSLPLCRANRTVHTSACDETDCGETRATELSSVLRVSSGLAVCCQCLQVHIWCDDSPLRHGEPGAASHQPADQDGPPGQEVSQRSGGQVRKKE